MDFVWRQLAYLTGFDAPTLSTLTAATESPDDGVAVPVVILAMVLSALAGVAGTLAFTAWRGRR